MASKSLNLLLNSALVTMAVGIVGFNTGLFNQYLPEKPAVSEPAVSETVSQDDAGVPEASGQAKPDTASDEPAAAAGDDNAVEEEQTAAENASTEDTADNQEMAALSEQPADEGVVEDANQSTEENAEPAATAEVVAPRFDIVRVEPDGNVVIAGNAATGSFVEVITGTRILGETTATGGGDFAVILTEPLDPGDYTIVLRATTPENLVAMSTETAIVSIPETESGEVLAIVNEPGKPSKLITVPEGEEEQSVEAGNGDTKVAAADNSAQSPASDDQVTTEQSDDSETADVSQQAEPEAETAAAGDEEGVSEQGAAEGDQKQETEDIATEMAAVSNGSDNAADQPVAEQEEPAEEAQPAGPGLEIAVEAVEIEGDHVFVAGTANPGKVVRIYANKDLIGETRASEVGRFLVESTQGLPVGEYIIRADMLDLGSAEVIARAAVPFERVEGESVAAVAPKADGGQAVTEETETEAQAGTTETAADETANAATDDDTTVAMADLKPADNGTSTDGDTSAARDDSHSGEAETSQITPDESEPTDTDAASSTTTSAGETSEATKADGDDSNGDAAKVIETEAAAAKGDADPKADDTNAATKGDTMNAAQDVTDADTDAGADADANDANAESEPITAGEEQQTASSDAGDEQTEVASAEPGTIKHAEFGEEIALTAPKLEKTSGAVIIRRGDTLWRISRRVYGRGIRYTTIYTANRDQIKNPHRIWPGQIFDVPGVSQDGELADLEAISDQSPQATETE